MDPFKKPVFICKKCYHLIVLEESDIKIGRTGNKTEIGDYATCINYLSDKYKYIGKETED